MKRVTLACGTSIKETQQLLNHLEFLALHPRQAHASQLVYPGSRLLPRILRGIQGIQCTITPIAYEYRIPRSEDSIQHTPAPVIAAFAWIDSVGNLIIRRDGMFRCVRICHTPNYLTEIQQKLLVLHLRMFTCGSDEVQSALSDQRESLVASYV